MHVEFDGTVLTAHKPGYQSYVRLGVGIVYYVQRGEYLYLAKMDKPHLSYTVGELQEFYAMGDGRHGK